VRVRVRVRVRLASDGWVEGCKQWMVWGVRDWSIRGSEATIGFLCSGLLKIQRPIDIRKDFRTLHVSSRTCFSSMSRKVP